VTPAAEFGYVDISSIDNRQFRVVSWQTITGRNAPSRARRPIQPDDVLFSNVRTYLRNIAIVPSNCPATLCSTGFTVIRSNGAALPRYLFHYVLSGSFVDPLTELQTGSSYPAVTERAVLTASISLPPLAEQRRIVEKIEAFLARVNAARERLARVPLILKRFRQSVLAAACSGRLTEDWRAHHTVEPAADALAESANSVNPRAIRHLVRRGSTGVPEVELPEIPDAWTNASVRQLIENGAILDFQDGNHGSLYPRAADFGDDGVRFLTAQQVFDNRVLLDSAPFLKRQKARLLRIGFAKPGDVLLTHNATVGRVAVLPQYDGDVILGTSVTYYRTNLAVLLSEFLCYAMQGKLWQDQLRSVMEQTTRNQVSVTKQVEFQLLIPPLTEQQEIVRRVAALFKLADAIERRVAAATARVEKLTQAILAKAFRGELVPTEAELARREGRDYEPASVLLERIRAERNGASDGDGEANQPRARRRSVRPATETAEATGAKRPGRKRRAARRGKP
jgi:type I restriction enzyme S subunit